MHMHNIQICINAYLDYMSIFIIDTIFILYLSLSYSYSYETYVLYTLIMFITAYVGVSLVMVMIKWKKYWYLPSYGDNYVF
jgi:hypothetical protein